MGYPMYEIIIREAALSFWFYFERPDFIEVFFIHLLFLIIQSQLRWNSVSVIVPFE